MSRMKWERRSVEFRAQVVGDGPSQDGLPRQFWARIMNYDVVDDYGTKFAPGAFTDSLQRRLPRLMYGHAGWENPTALLGRGIEFRDSKEGLDVLFEFDDFEYVPMARQIAYQLSNDPDNPTLNEFSVGFVRVRDTRGTDGKPVITKARLGEGSIVVEGSVPGTKLLSFRSGDGKGEPFAQGALLDANDAARILARFSLGEMDLAQALEEVKSAVVAENTDEEDDEPNETPAEEEVAETSEETEATADAEDPDAGDAAPAEGTSAESEEVSEGNADESPASEEQEEDDDDEEEEARLLAEIDADLADVEMVLRSAPAETRDFHGNQHAGSQVDTSDVAGTIHVGRLRDTPEADHATWASKPASTVVALGGGARVLTTRTKMWSEGAWTPHLSFATEMGGKTVGIASSVAGAKALVGSDVVWTDR